MVYMNKYGDVRNCVTSIKIDEAQNTGGTIGGVFQRHFQASAIRILSLEISKDQLDEIGQVASVHFDLAVGDNIVIEDFLVSQDTKASANLDLSFSTIVKGATGNKSEFDISLRSIEDVIKSCLTGKAGLPIDAKFDPLLKGSWTGTAPFGYRPWGISLNVRLSGAGATALKDKNLLIKTSWVTETNSDSSLF